MKKYHFISVENGALYGAMCITLYYSDSLAAWPNSFDPDQDSRL